MMHFSNMSEQLQENRKKNDLEESITFPRAHPAPQKKMLFSLFKVVRGKEDNNLTSAHHCATPYCDVPFTEPKGLFTQGTHADFG